MQSNLSQTYNEINPIIHNPARLLILSILELLEYADFKYLLNETGLTKGNLSSHMSKLETVGYIEIQKKFKNNMPLTTYNITQQGLSELTKYRDLMKSIIQ